MGARPSTTFSYDTNIPIIYNKDLVVSYEVLSSILALGIGQSYNLGFTAPISSLQAILPEFVFNKVQYDLYTVTRSLYLGDSQRCCISGENVFTVSGVYITCPPALKTPGATRSCDLVLSNYCFATPVSTNICTDWFKGYVQARGYDAFTILGYDHCRTEAQRSVNPFCAMYLNIMRENPDTTVHDNFLDQIRDSTFRCSYPLQKTQVLAKSTNLPRVCWDPNCISTPSWKMKSIDYLTRYNCNVISSNITFNVEDPSTLNNITVQTNATQLAEFRQVLQDQNIYTKPLKDVGKGFLDVFPIIALIGLSIVLALE